MGTTRRDDADPELDALRLRLYRPDATPEDLRRYEDALAAAGRAPAGAAAGPAPRSGRRPRLTVALGVALALAVLVAAGAAIRMSAPSSPSVPAARPLATPRLADDLLRWQPERPIAGVRLVDAPGVQQFHGRGAGEALLEGRGLPGTAGRLEVMLTVEDTAPVRWTATRVDIGPGSIVDVQVLAEYDGTQRQAVPLPVVFSFTGGPPTAVHVQVPRGVAWGLVVAPA